MSEGKRAAGRRAAELAEDGMALGLGTGSTVAFALERLAERIRDEGLRVRGVPTSLDTEEKARELGIPLAGLEEAPDLDLAIDGADEVDARLDLVKGGGGALLREKVVAAASRRVAIAVDRSKLVERLGARFLLPVEVVPFARPRVARDLERLGAEPALRMADARRPYRTDNGNEILDCRFSGGIEDPAALEDRLAHVPGLVESGLFVGLCDLLVVGSDDGSVELRERS